jgi:oligopeptide/dipeptide ABC transporter ATP-binding protein
VKAGEVPLLEVSGLSISFETDNGLLHAVNKASLRVESGEIIGIIGQSGSGKTTLMMGLLGLLRGKPGVREGKAFFQGKPLLSQGSSLMAELRGRDIAVIFQEPRAALDPFFRIGEHMREALLRGGSSGSEAEIRNKGLELLRDVGLVDTEQLWDVFPHQISGGMAQRVMIAMALSAKPKLLVADEPSTALDVTTQAKLLELFKRLRDKHGLSIILISHDIGVIQETCSRVYVMHRGDIVEQGETAEVLHHSKHPYTQSLIQAFAYFASGERKALVGAATPETLVEAKGLRKRFGLAGKSFEALDEVSLFLRAGETYAVVGESGSGKSTLALSMMALQGVDGGEVLYRGENWLKSGKSRIRELRRAIRMLFQHPEAVLNAGMTVEATLREALEREDVRSPAEVQERISKVLEQVHLDPVHAKRYPSNLSSGEKQRVTIARALITRPKVLVCDEPVASLDLAIQAQILELLREFQEKMGLTYLFISHNLALVKLLAHRIGVMYMGRLIEEAPAEDFTVERARHPYTRLLLASVPSLDDEKLRGICAEFPDVEPVRLQTGCPFRNRCPLYLRNHHAECETVLPPLRDIKKGKVACHLADA